MTSIHVAYLVLLKRQLKIMYWYALVWISKIEMYMHKYKKDKYCNVPVIGQLQNDWWSKFVLMNNEKI